VEDGRVSQRLSALVVVAGLVLLYPFVSAVGAVSFILGIPVFYLYLFACWAVVIVLVGATMWWERPATKRQKRAQ
jgi:hypothetical protein